MDDKRIFNWHLVVWPVLTWLIASGICYWLDKRDPAMELVYKSLPEPGGVTWRGGRGGELVPIAGNPLEWAPMAWGLIALFIVLYTFGVWAIYQNAKRNNRNAIRWTTAAIIFSPVLAWAAYGLSWRKC